MRSSSVQKWKRAPECRRQTGTGSVPKKEKKETSNDAGKRDTRNVWYLHFCFRQDHTVATIVWYSHVSFLLAQSLKRVTPHRDPRITPIPSQIVIGNRRHKWNNITCSYGIWQFETQLDLTGHDHYMHPSAYCFKQKIIDKTWNRPSFLALAFSVILVLACILSRWIDILSRWIDILSRRMDTLCKSKSKVMW